MHRDGDGGIMKSEDIYKDGATGFEVIEEDNGKFRLNAFFDGMNITTKEMDDATMEGLLIDALRIVMKGNR